MNNFAQEFSKADLNLFDRAIEIINSLFYDNIPVNNTKSQIEKFSLKELKKKFKIEDIIFHCFDETLKKDMKKITIRIGKKESYKNSTCVIFGKEYKSEIKPLFDINNQS